MLALIATGMVLIAGIRNDVNLLESQVAFTGRALVNKNVEESGTSEKVVNNVPVKNFSMAEIENTIKKLGWAKQTDNSYSSGSKSSEKHYVCTNCNGLGSECSVVNGIGSQGESVRSAQYYGITNYQGICSVDSTSVVTPQRTTSGSTGSGSTAEKPKACRYSDTCPQGQACKNNFCVPCWGQGCVDGASRVSNPGTSNPILTTTLRLGTVSNDVTKLQKMLVSLGFLTATPSGNFLSKTDAGVKAFQTAYGISPVSGIVGPLTRAKLNSMCTISSDGSAVSCSQ